MLGFPSPRRENCIGYGLFGFGGDGKGRELNLLCTCCSWFLLEKAGQRNAPCTLNRKGQGPLVPERVCFTVKDLAIALCPQTLALLSTVLLCVRSRTVGQG